MITRLRSYQGSACAARPLEVAMTPTRPHPTPPSPSPPPIRWWQTLPAIHAGILLIADAVGWITQHIGPSPG